jgi:hypothetical protein
VCTDEAAIHRAPGELFAFVPSKGFHNYHHSFPYDYSTGASTSPHSSSNAWLPLGQKKVSKATIFAMIKRTRRWKLQEWLRFGSSAFLFQKPA